MGTSAMTAAWSIILGVIFSLPSASAQRTPGKSVDVRPRPEQAEIKRRRSSIPCTSREELERRKCITRGRAAGSDCSRGRGLVFEELQTQWNEDCARRGAQDVYVMFSRAVSAIYCG